MAEALAFLSGILAILIIIIIALSFFIPTSVDHAEFVCETHGLKLIDYELEGKGFSKVECGHKKPELQYDDYKVFEKWIESFGLKLD